MENELFMVDSGFGAPMLHYDPSDCFWDKPPHPPPSNSSPATSNDRSFVVRELGVVDPQFVERAARLSCFAAGSRSFNSRPASVAGGLHRVSSSPSLKELPCPNPNPNPSFCANSQDESTLSEQKNPNPRKRKASSKSKPKELPISNSAKRVEIDEDDSNVKRNKLSEGNGNGSENGDNSGDDKQEKSSPKPPEPPKDYIHVRARRGQATDSHSLAERVRREKISERMKLLQDLVPGCNKVTGKALMLDEIINYVQSLQRQVEFLSMKLSSVNTRLDCNSDTLMSKDVFQSNNSMSHPIFPLDSSAQSIFGHHQPHQNQAIHSNNISSGPINQCPIDTIDMPFPQLHGFTDILSQYPIFGEDDLQSIVQMGFGPISSRDSSLQPQNIHGQNQVSHMKIEL